MTFVRSQASPTLVESAHVNTAAATPPPQAPETAPEYSEPLLAATAPSVSRARTIPSLRLRRLMGVSLWALVLAGCGLPVGAIGMFKMMGDVGAWFQPAFVSAGVVGLMLTSAAFVTVRYRTIPWWALGASTVIFVAGVVMLALG